MAFKHYDEVTCDLCKQKIDHTKPFPQLIYPFTDDEVQKLASALAERLPLPPSVLGLGIIPVERFHKFHFCQGCVDGFMPMLEELKKLAFRAQLDDLEKRSQSKRLKTKKDGDGDDVIEIDLNE